MKKVIFHYKCGISWRKTHQRLGTNLRPPSAEDPNMAWQVVLKISPIPNMGKLDMDNSFCGMKTQFLWPNFCDPIFMIKAHQFSENPLLWRKSNGTSAYFWLTNFHRQIHRLNHSKSHVSSNLGKWNHISLTWIIYGHKRGWFPYTFTMISLWLFNIAMA